MVAERSPAAAGEDEDARVGVVLGLGAVVMLFAGLLFAYGFLRAQLPQWPPGGQVLPRGLPAFNVFLLGASSALLGARRPRVALALGIVFLAGQGVLFAEVSGRGFRGPLNLVSSVVLALSLVHGLHLLAGLVGLGLAVGGRRRAAWDAKIGRWAAYWHTVGALGGVFLVAVFFV